MAPGRIDHCDDGELVFVQPATHRVHHAVPGVVNGVIAGFFGD